MAGRPIELGPSGESVATNVQRLRKGQKLTWTDVARSASAAGRPMSALAVRRIEEGGRRVDADDLVALAVVLGVTPTTLLLPDNGGDDVEEATATGPATAAALWAWAERWEPLPSQRSAPAEVPDELTGVARGRAMYEADQRTAAERWRQVAGPQGAYPGDHEFLAQLREALRFLPAGARVRVWSDDGRPVAEYPPQGIAYHYLDEPGDRDGQRWAQLRAHVVAILTSDAVRPLVPAILEDVEKAKR